jgi:hypothetical protein
VVLRCYQEAVMKQKKLRAERRFFFLIKENNDDSVGQTVNWHILKLW